MSKIFEVMRKDGAINIEEVHDERSGLPNAPIEQFAGLTGAPDVGSQETERLVSLRVSALAPIFPASAESHSAAAEQYRIIRTKILHSAKKPRSIVVSSACAGDGKTVTSINIAASLSLKSTASVLLVDADLRKPRIAELLGINVAPGLTDVLSGRASLAEAITRTREFPTLSILTSGEKTQNATELLDSEQWRRLIEEMKDRFSTVIMDAPPAAVLADYDLLQSTADGVILVVRPDNTDRTACAKILQSIAKEKFLGVVLNCVPEWLLSKSSDYYYYATK